MRRLSVAVVSLGFLLFAEPQLAAQKPLISQQALITFVENHKGAVLRFIGVAPDSMLGSRPSKGVRAPYSLAQGHVLAGGAYAKCIPVTDLWTPQTN